MDLNDEYYYDAWNNLGTMNTPSYVDSSGNDPTSMASGGMGGFNFGPMAAGLKFGGDIFAGYGSLLEGKQKAKAFQYNTQLVLDQNTIEIGKLDKIETILASQQRAGYLKSGVTLAGSPLDVMVESSSRIQMDKQIANYNAQSKANMLDYQANMAKYEGRMKFGQSFIKGGLGLLGL